MQEEGRGWLPGALPPLSRRDRGSVPCHPQQRESTHARHPPRQRTTTRGKPTGVALPPPVCRAGSPAEHCPERGAALGETEAAGGGCGGYRTTPGTGPLGGGSFWAGGWVG